MTRQELIHQIQLKKSYLCVGLDTDFDKIPRIEISLDTYQGKKQVTNITELELMQINFARQVIIQDGSYYSQTLKDGGYLFDDLSKWQVFDVDICITIELLGFRVLVTLCFVSIERVWQGHSCNEGDVVD